MSDYSQSSQTSKRRSMNKKKNSPIEKQKETIDEGENEGRTISTPSSVPQEVENSMVFCTRACLISLNFDVKQLHKVTASNDFTLVYWRKVLEICYPQAVIQYFDKGSELANLTSETLDHLIVATVNKKLERGNHAMIVRKRNAQTVMGNKIVQLYNPGETLVLKNIDLTKKRLTSSWNMICAAFLANTDIENEMSDDLV